LEKMTNIGGDLHPTLRSVYDEGCIGAHALDLLGDRWAILVIRELVFGPKRFGMIRAGLPGISASVLTQRLEGLEVGGAVRRVALPEPADVHVYELTELGQTVRPVIDALCRFGAKLPGHDPSKFISPSALMLSMVAMVNRKAAREETISAGFDLGRETFRGALFRGLWRPERGRAEGDVVFAGNANALARVIYGRAPLDHWIATDSTIFQGDPVLGQRFVDLFRLR
jgi:DNA-binding HxlR family transcriptional regulator